MFDKSIHGLIINKNIIHDCNIVVNHKCNKHCKTCIDKFLDIHNDEVKIQDVRKYLTRLHDNYINECQEVFLLGGEPTCSDISLLIDIAELSHSLGYKVKMSTNGLDRNKILSLSKYYDVFQITARNQEDINFWKSSGLKDKITIKYNGDENFTLEDLNWFINETKDFYHKSINMFHSKDGKVQLCTDKRIWDLIIPLRSESHLMYHVAWYENVRIKWG